MTARTDWPVVEVDCIDMTRAAAQLLDEVGSDRCVDLAVALARVLASQHLGDLAIVTVEAYCASCAAHYVVDLARAVDGHADECPGTPDGA